MTAHDADGRPDLGLAAAYLATRTFPGRPLLCGVTGAHHYGFPSPDSDLDLKGIHLAPTAALLGLDRPKETVDGIEIFRGVECDLTSHEAGKALDLLVRGNGNLLERILSPFQVLETPELAELQELARASVGRHFFGHYRGYLRGMRREHEREPKVKSMLYTLRVALTGVHLLRSGELEADLGVNGPRYGMPEVAELIARKRAGDEKAPLPEAEDARFRALWPRLEELLDEARTSSPLPEKVPNRPALHDWLVRTRLAQLA